MAETTETPMTTETDYGATMHTLLVHHPTAWATKLLDALHEGWNLFVEHQDDLTRVIIHHSDGITVRDLRAALDKPDSLDLDTISRGPEAQKTTPKKADPSY